MSGMRRAGGAAGARELMTPVARRRMCYQRLAHDVDRCSGAVRDDEYSVYSVQRREAA